MKFQFINTFGLRERVAKCNCLGGTPFNTFWNSLELDPPTWEIAINFEICYPLPIIVERRKYCRATPGLVFALSFFMAFVSLIYLLCSKTGAFQFANVCVSF